MDSDHPPRYLASFAYIILLHLPHSSARKVRLSAFYIWENWGWEKPRDLSKIIQLVGRCLNTQSQVPWVCKSWSLPFYHAASKGLAVTLSQGSSKVVLLTFWSGQFFVVGTVLRIAGCFNNTPGFYPLGAKSFSLSCDTKNVPGYCQVSSGGNITSKWKLLLYPFLFYGPL